MEQKTEHIPIYFLEEQIKLKHEMDEKVHKIKHPFKHAVGKHPALLYLLLGLLVTAMLASIFADMTRPTVTLPGDWQSAVKSYAEQSVKINRSLDDMMKKQDGSDIILGENGLLDLKAQSDSIMEGMVNIEANVGQISNDEQALLDKSMKIVADVHLRLSASVKLGKIVESGV